MPISRKSKGARRKGRGNGKVAATDPQVVLQRKQKYSIRGLFKRLGFTRFKSDGFEFKFKGRTGELDDIFVFENVVVLAEYTVGRPDSAHIAKKSLLYNLINAHQADWMEFAQSHFEGFSELDYRNEEYRVCICYFSLYGVSEEIYDALSYVYFLNGTKFRYFDALAKTIHRSARFEFFKYLGIEFKRIGAEIRNSSNERKEFSGYVLPESYSSFPRGFKVVSFYADPAALLSMSYVLRRDSWRDEEGLYQRVLMKGRMRDMRKYLTTEERVFVNNIIVTLPRDTKLNDPNDSGQNIDPRTIDDVRNVVVAVPFRSDVIGIVDGQHRVFCYHEGEDVYEAKIKKLRGRQNLLVTGIVYPGSYSDADKRRFEARLFLEINDKQRSTRSDLRQSIELILSPYSTIAIAKAVIHRLNSNGALKGMLQTNYFDPPKVLRTSSIVSYGLRPLLKLDGGDSLFSAWTSPNKAKLQALQNSRGDPANLDPVLDEYIGYCVQSLNDILIAARKSMGSAKWSLSDRAQDRYLSPTIINGLIVCLRILIENGRPLAAATYDRKFAELGNFDFSKYRSSSWRALGLALHKKYFT